MLAAACTCHFILFLCRFLFWTEYRFGRGVITRFNLADGIKVTLTGDVGSVYAIKLDCNKKRVYWLEYSSGMKSSDYRGQEKKIVKIGQFNRNILGVSGDSLYFLHRNKYRINEMNVSNGNILGTVLIDRGVWYYDLVVVDKSVQPTCK